MEIERPEREPERPAQVADEDRAATTRKLEQAVGNGRLTLDEYTRRVDRAYQAGNSTELAALTDDLAQAVVGSQPASVSSSVALFEPVVRAGTWRLPARSKAVAIFCDIELDLRQVTAMDSEIYIEAKPLFGDIRITVPEGIEVILEADPTLPNTHICALAPVPRRPGTPLIRVQPSGWFRKVHIESRAPDQQRLSTPQRERRRQRGQ